MPKVMIPTRYKSKLSYLMSYPIGTGKLSQALADVPQINDLSVAFFDSCQHPSKLENPCRILSIGYFYRQVSLTTRNKSIEQGEYGAKWEITVHPVPRICVSDVRSQLDEEGLNEICQWLHQYQNATDKDGCCWLHLLYDSEVKKLSYSEQDKLLG